MIKLTSHLIFLGFLPTILLHELNFDSDELLSGKEIAFLNILLVDVPDISFVRMLVSKLVLLSKMSLVISHNFGLGFSIKFK